MKVIEGLYYSKDHEWVKVEENKAYIGITDHAQHSLGDIVFVELPGVDDELSKEDTFGVVESVKAASDIFIPIDGKVVEINEDLEDEPELLNKDAFENWMILVEIIDDSQLDELMDAKEYERFCSEEA